IEQGGRNDVARERRPNLSSTGTRDETEGIVDLVGKPAEIPGGDAVALGDGGDGLRGGAGIVDLLALIIHKKERFVLQDGTTEGSAVLVLVCLGSRGARGVVKE